MSRTTRGIAPLTGISVAHMRGTAWKPSLRAASAGNSAVRSGVTVNRTLITSSGVRSLRVITAVTSSAVPSRLLLLAVAPCHAGCALEPDGGVQLADLLRGQVPGRAGPEAAELDRADGGAQQPADRVVDLGEHPADDVLTALVQCDLDHRAAACLLKDTELVGDRDAVV